MRINSSRRIRQTLSLLVLFTLMASVPAPYQAIAFTRGSAVVQSDPEEDAVTFDNLLPAESYGIYGEVRNVGQQIAAGGFRSIFETLLPLMGELPKEISRTVLFASAHANELARSRMMLATLPARRNLPSAIMAIELSSSEAAKAFEPEFREFVTSLLMSGAGQAQKPPFFIKSMGRLVVLSDTAFTLKQLKPDGQKLLSNDPYFRDARAHFSSEDIFVYYDSKQYEQASKQTYEEMKAQAEATAAQEGSPDIATSVMPAQPSSGTPLITGEAVVEEESPAPPVPEEEKADKKEEPEKGDRTGKQEEAAKVAAAVPAMRVESAGGSKSEDEKAQVAAQEPPPPDGAGTGSMRTFDSLLNMVFNGMSRQQVSAYESIAFALTFEGDTFAGRILFLNSPGAEVAAIPFIPFLISGPPLTLAASNYLPADTDILVSGSLNLARVYDEVYPTLSESDMTRDSRKAATGGRSRRGRAEINTTFAARAAAFEKKRGVKIKDELLPALGNEIAVALPLSLFSTSSASPPPKAPASPEQSAAQVGPLFVISVQNRQLLQPHIPALLELFDLMKAGEKVTIEKRGEIEIKRYASASFALVDNVLIAAQDVRDVRRALDARASGQTLGASKEFRDYARWQPRHLLNQVHVSSSLMKGMLSDMKKSAAQADDRTKEFFAQLNYTPEPISYAASMEVLGSQHEIRLPKNLIVTLIASMLASYNQTILPRNEMMAKSTLIGLNSAQETYHTDNGRYATLDELAESGLVEKYYLEQYGYRFDVTAAGGKYQVNVTPVEYGKTGKDSFYTDETKVIRGGDHGGKPASAQDKPVVSGE